MVLGLATNGIVVMMMVMCKFKKKGRKDVFIVDLSRVDPRPRPHHDITMHHVIHALYSTILLLLLLSTFLRFAPDLPCCLLYYYFIVAHITVHTIYSIM